MSEMPTVTYATRHRQQNKHRYPVTMILRQISDVHHSVKLIGEYRRSVGQSMPAELFGISLGLRIRLFYVETCPASVIVTQIFGMLAKRCITAAIST